MTTQNTHSINEISIAINSLFRDISEPITFILNKSNLLETYKNTFFRYDNTAEFEFETSPILQFKNAQILMDFLEREKQLAVRFQDFANASEIKNMINEKNDTVSLDNFYLNYTIEINGDEILIFFNTNSFVFKYEVIG